MVRGGLAAHDHLVVLLQNAFAVIAISTAAALGFVRVRAVDRPQLAFYAWDALVLVIQLWTSFKALQHLPVSATRVVRALAIPGVAWLELVLLGAKLRAARHCSAWLVVAGAALYASEDLADSSEQLRAGYCWAAANLACYCSNSVLDRVMMSRSQQTAAGLALFTQLLSLPISVGHGVGFHGLGLRSTLALLHSLDVPTALALAGTGALAALLGSAYALCYQRASATTVTCAGNANKVVAIVTSSFIFGSRVSYLQARATRRRPTRPRCAA
jgi:hypothetical protein